MDKKQLLHLITEKLAADLEVAVRAAQATHEMAARGEDVAESKYDTLGLEAAYLAAGQSRRVEEVRQALGLHRSLVLRDFDEKQDIQLTALVTLLNAGGSRRAVFLGPEVAGLKINCRGREVLVVTPRSPLSRSLIGRHPDDGTEAKDPPLVVEILAVDWDCCCGAPQAPQNFTPAARSTLQAIQHNGARAPPQP